LPRRLAPLVPTTTLSQYYIDNIANESDSQKDIRFENALVKAKRIFLYFHGNACNRATFTRPQMYKIMSNIAQMDSHVISIDYRGFGDSSWVTPTELGLQIDAMTAYQYLISLGVQQERIIIVGHSLGSGVAAHLSASLSIKGKAPGGLILLSAYASIPGILGV
jgi:abhydrolase domain-containing protein 12